MAHGRRDEEIIKSTHNVARFFTEKRQIAWVVLLGTVVWGIYGYLNMPKRKDPDITVRVAVAVCPWPGVNAEKVEQLVTRKIEQKITENSKLGGGTDPRTFSKTRDSLASVYVVLNENVSVAQRVVAKVAPALAGKPRTCACAHALKDAIITDRAIIPRQVAADLDLLIGKYL